MDIDNQQDINETTPKAFMVLHAFSCNGGPMLIAATIAAYFLVFMTDTMLIPASSAALIILIASIWDIFNDPIMGVVADKTHTRWGRYRPYFLVIPTLFTIISILLFLNPEGLTVNQKVYYIGALYIIYGTLFTLVSMPHMAILPAVTRNNDFRNKTITLGAVGMSASFTIAMSGTPKMLEWFGGSYVPIIAIYGLFGVLTYWGLFLISKEKYIVHSPKTEKTNLKKELGVLFKHKELYPIAATWVMCSMGYALMFGSSVFYLLYFLGRPDLIAAYMATITIGAFISMAVCMPLMLKFAKYGYKALYFSQAITFFCYTACYFIGDSSISGLFVFSTLATISGGMAMGLINILVNDLIDFIQNKENLNMNGIIASIKGFCQKIGNSYVNAGLLALLATFGYVAGAIGKQPEEVKLLLNVVRFGFPAILCLVTVVLMKNYSLKEFVENRDKSSIQETVSDEVIA